MPTELQSSVSTAPSTPKTDTGPKPSVCFVLPGAYNVLSGRGDLRRIGGAEVQMVTLARALCDLGFPIRFVTWDHGQPDGEVIDGITVYKCYDLARGVPVLRFVHPRWTGLNAAMFRADADIYVQACSDSLTGQVALWTRRHGRKFVFFVMHDWDCTPELRLLQSRREQALYRYGLRRADTIVAQSNRQRSDLAVWPGIDSTVIRPSGGRTDDNLPLASWSGDERPRVIWVGRFSQEKRLEWLLDVAHLLPEFDFDVLGGANRDDSYANGFIDNARQVPNLTLHGAVPRTDMDRFYQRAQVLLSTSSGEGYPSVFIEAWSWGLPVVATLDVDGLIQEHRLGVVASDVRGLAAAVRGLLSSSDRWEETSTQARNFYLTAHRPAGAAARVGRLLMSLHAPPDVARHTFAQSKAEGCCTHVHNES